MSNKNFDRPSAREADAIFHGKKGKPISGDTDTSVIRACANAGHEHPADNDYNLPHTD